MDEKKKNNLQTLSLVIAGIILYILVAEPTFIEDWMDSGGGVVEKVAIFMSKENAALNYLDAIDEMRFPLNKKLQEDVITIIRKGWTPNPQIEKLITQNKPCLDISTPAVNMLRCNFNFGRKMKSSLKYPLMLQMRKIGYLYLIKGRYLESKGNLMQAIQSYHYVLLLSQQLFQDNESRTKDIAIELREYLIYPLISIVNNPDTPAPILNQIKKILEDRRDEKFSTLEFVEGEKEKFQDHLQRLQVLIRRSYTNQSIYELRTFNISLRREGNKLADTHFFTLDKYAESEDPSYLIQHYLSTLRLKSEVNLDNSFYTTSRIFKKFNEEIELAILEGLQQQYEVLARIISKYLLMTSMEIDYSNFLNNYNRTHRALKSLEIIARIKAQQKSRKKKVKKPKKDS